MGANPGFYDWIQNGRAFQTLEWDDPGVSGAFISGKGRDRGKGGRMTSEVEIKAQRGGMPTMVRNQKGQGKDSPWRKGGPGALPHIHYG